jgi:hypothetical protein
MRRAGSLDLSVEDVAALRSFRAYVGAGRWYEREALKVVRRGAKLLEQGHLADRERIQMFEIDDDLVAVGVFGPESDITAHVGFVGLRRGVHGARIDRDDGPRLSDSVLESCFEEASSLGFRRATVQVARDNEPGRALATRVGFRVLSRFDADYDLWAVDLT